MQKSNINPAIFQQMLESAPNASAKGQAQYFTPVEWARALALPLPLHRPVLVDLTCGNGQLLTGASRHTHDLLGCDIDPGSDECPVRVGPHFVAGDLTKFHSLLRECRFTADCLVLNPPWDMHWPRARLAGLSESSCRSVADAFAAHDGRTGKTTIDSTIATLCLALNLCSQYGEGLLIANEATLQRLIFAPGAPHGALVNHIWAHLSIPGNICLAPGARPSALIAPSGNDFKTGVFYFARSPQSGNPSHYAVTDLASATAQLHEVRRQRIWLRRGAEAGKSRDFSDESLTAWAAAREEWHRLNSPVNQAPIWNIYMDGPVLRTNLSLFDKQSDRVAKAEVARLFELNGKTPMSLVVQVAHRKELERAAFGTTWRVAPAVQDSVRLALSEYETMRAPLTTLNPIQRLGYLDEQDEILCHTSLAPAFQAGLRYPIRTLTISVRRDGTKMNLTGTLDKVEWAGSELAIYVGDHLFMEARNRDASVTLSLKSDPDNAPSGQDAPSRKDITIDFTLHELVSHFTIPEVPDVATKNPALYQRLIADLHIIEQIVAV